MRQLRAEEVHVWEIDLEQSEEAIQAFHGLLNEKERAQAARYRFEKDRKHYTVGRGVMRTLLGEYLGIKPTEVEFAYGEHGKPELAGETDLRFNLSHSGGRALLGVTRGREIGVDLEFAKEMKDMEGIVEHFFAKQEIEVLFGLPAEQRKSAFFRCWARKEAYLKALGSGLAKPLDGFVVTLTPDEPARLVEVVGQPEEVERWTMLALDLGPDYGAAICVEGSGWEVVRHTWRHKTVEVI